MYGSRLILKEFNEITKNPIQDVTIGLVKHDLYHWEGAILGPSNTPFEFGVFFFEIWFNSEYPLRAPSIKLMTRIYHPNVGKRGELSLDIFKNGIKSVTVRDIIQCLVSTLKNPNCNESLQTDIARQYKNDYAAFERKAREWTQMYAT